jgi:hypothetical protein
MAEAEVKTVRVHYRLAKFIGDPQAVSLQQSLTNVMNSALGKDSRERILPMADDPQHQGCLNYWKAEKQFFVADIMHLDGRTTLPRWIHPTEPRPFAEVVPRAVAEGEASLGEPVYILVAGNHLAAIERLSFRTMNLTRYVNALLSKAGQLANGHEWRLVPKIDIRGESWHAGGVKKIVFKPLAAVQGDGPSRAGPEPKRRRGKAAAAAFENLVLHGHRVIEALVSFGADQAKLDQLREAMSTDLILKAKLEISVASVRRKTAAVISSDLVQQALAELAQEGEVIIESDDGRSNGKLVQLVDTREVLETGGLIDWSHATQALSSSMSAWAAKGAIELSE